MRNAPTSLLVPVDRPPCGRTKLNGPPTQTEMSEHTHKTQCQPHRGQEIGQNQRRESRVQQTKQTADDDAVRTM